VIYTVHSGAAVTIPFCGIYQMRDGLIASYQVFIDPAPLYEALKQS
jgi:ketosteroid isomerase-like protein